MSKKGNLVIVDTLLDTKELFLYDAADKTKQADQARSVLLRRYQDHVRYRFFCDCREDGKLIALHPAFPKEKTLSVRRI